MATPPHTFTTAETNSLLTGAVVPFRANTLPTGLHEPMATQTAQQVAGMLTHSAIVKQNGGPADTAPRGVDHPFATFTTIDTTALISAQTWDLLDLHWRMLTVPEIRRGMGFREDFIVWGTSRQRVAGFGNAVVPAQGQWVVEQLTPCIQGAVA